MSDEERERRVRLFTPWIERLVALIRGRVRLWDARCRRWAGGSTHRAANGSRMCASPPMPSGFKLPSQRHLTPSPALVAGSSFTPHAGAVPRQL